MAIIVLLILVLLSFGIWKVILEDVGDAIFATLITFLTFPMFLSMYLSYYTSKEVAAFASTCKGTVVKIVGDDASSSMACIKPDAILEQKIIR